MESQIFTGNTGRLQKYIGIIQPVKALVEGMTAAEKKANPQKLKHNEQLDKEATAMLANTRLLEKFGGATNAYSHTTAGALSNASHSWDLVIEKLGKVFLPIVAEGAQDLSKLALAVEKGDGVWGELGGTLRTVGQDAKSVWQFFEHDKFALTGLETILASLAGLWAANKVRSFASALGLLGVEGEAGAAGLSSLVPEMAAVALGAAGLVGAAKGIHALVEAVSPGYLKEHSLHEVHGALAGAGKGTEYVKNQDGHYEIKPKRGFAHTQGGGKPAPLPHTGSHAGQVHVYDRANGKWVWVHPGETLPGPTAKGASETHVHLHLDGKEIAHSTAKHIATDPAVARHVTEGVHKYALRRQARS